MSPRPYRMEQRRAGSARTRARIVAAARNLLSSRRREPDFSVETIAERAGVARMTVYYQFGSKRGLLEALFDDMARRGLVERLSAAFQSPTPELRLLELLDAFCFFWAAERTAIRRLRALAALDAGLDQAIHERDQRRREAISTVLVGSPQIDQLDAARLDDLSEVLSAVASFEMYDLLAKGGRTTDEVSATVKRLALRSIEDAIDAARTPLRTAG